MRGLILAIWLAANPVFAAEYYRWVDDSGVLHITDNLHNVRQRNAKGANRIQAKESPRVAEPEIKVAAPALRKASIPIERHGNIVIVPVTLNNAKLLSWSSIPAPVIPLSPSARPRPQHRRKSQPQNRPLSHCQRRGRSAAHDPRLDHGGRHGDQKLTAAIHDTTPDAQAAAFWV
jgi:hypothetical protein